MIDIPAVRRLIHALPEAEDGSDEHKLAFLAGGKQFAWTYLERVRPRAPRRPRLDMLAVRCTLDKKEMLIAAAPGRFFDDDHYRGFPAVLVRLDGADQDELAALLGEAGHLVAPARPRDG